MNPRFPVYVPTKGRWATQHTIKALDRIGVPYMAVVEPQEVGSYVGAGVPRERILVLPFMNQGLVATRNWIWDHAAASGAKRFWTMDDNSHGFYRLNRNLKIPVASGTILYVMEDFVERYENVVIAGMNYHTFADQRSACAPFNFNRRVYSNMLIDTFAADPRGKPYRNEGHYNDDTDLNLRVLKDGNCTVLFNTFLFHKIATMTVKGGMDYKRSADKEKDSRYIASRELQLKHPDVTKIVQRWGRWHHHVDYSRFANNEPRLRPGVVVPDGVNDYGMVLQVDGADARDHELAAPRTATITKKQWCDLLNVGTARGLTVDAAAAIVRERFGCKVQELKLLQYDEAAALLRGEEKR